MTLVFILLVVIQVSNGQAEVRKDKWSKTPLKKVSKIDLPAKTLDGKWRASGGLKLDDLSDLSNVPESNRKPAAAVAAQLEPIGVHSVADYSLTSTSFPLNTVTVRVFVFEDSTKCKKWWMKKYEYEGWEKHYSKIECESAHVVRSTQTNKAAMAFGNVWLTTHQLGKGREHIDAANYVLRQLTHETKTLPEDACKSPSRDPAVSDTSDKSPSR